MRWLTEIPKALVVGGIGGEWTMTRAGTKIDYGLGGVELACAVIRERRGGAVEVRREGDVYEDIDGKIQELGPVIFLSDTVKRAPVKTEA